MGEVGEACSRKLGMVGAILMVCRKLEALSFMGVDGRGGWEVEVCMVEIEVVFGEEVRDLLGEVELLEEEWVDKGFESSGWVGLGGVSVSGED